MWETHIDVWQFILIIDLVFGYLVAIQYLNSDLRLKLSGVYSCKGVGTEVVNLLFYFFSHISFRGFPDPNERFSMWYRREYISIYIMQLPIDHSTETKQICTFYFTGTEAIDLFIVWSYWIYGFPGPNGFNSRVVQRKGVVCRHLISATLPGHA